MTENTLRIRSWMQPKPCPQSEQARKSLEEKRAAQREWMAEKGIGEPAA